MPNRQEPLTVDMILNVFTLTTGNMNGSKSTKVAEKVTLLYGKNKKEEMNGKHLYAFDSAIVQDDEVYFMEI
eukprot:12225491-Ditylum_brightwellii.AAC.1